MGEQQITTATLKGFIRWVIENGSFAGCDLNGGDVQDKAVACGILVATTYDPEVHGGDHCCEKGDDWFVYSDAFTAA